MKYNYTINPHNLRIGIMRDFDSKWYPEEIETVISMEEENKKLHRLKLGIVKNFDSKCYPKENERKVYISDAVIHHSLQTRRIHLIQLFGYKKYKKIINKVKCLSR